ncbi:hypothetical protein CRD60_06550 [Bifidobacterium aemilianum]|uniref:Uncharacterized protein n=1 Tax=Bifidobacterium aemilianum TaxID=2493120 RepID=A0A366K8D8_9BIFI|nr:hypothetical protein CRD60_06550 [Bifidobacterium aemilianum]
MNNIIEFCELVFNVFCELNGLDTQDSWQQNIILMIMALVSDFIHDLIRSFVRRIHSYLHTLLRQRRRNSIRAHHATRNN